MSNIHTLQVVGSKCHTCKLYAVLGTVSLALLGASQAQAAPSANGAVHAVTGMEHANYHATINCGNNVRVMTPQPGTDLMPFNMTTSSPNVEAFYNRAARQRVKWLDTVECEQTNFTNASGFSTNWSGWEIDGGVNHFVQSGWTVPYVGIPSYQPGYNNGYHSSTWIGLGGGLSSNFSSNHPLIQTGVHEIAYSNGSTEYYFWYEVYPQQYEMKISTSTLSVKAGDLVGGTVTWIPGNTAVVGICDWNTNRCVNFNIDGISEPSNSTEWVHEAPSYNNVIQPIPVFSQINFFNGCWAATTSLSRTSKSGVPYTLDPLDNGITGSVDNCQSINAGSPLLWIAMQLTPLYMPGYPVISKPSTSFGSNGSDFSITYGP